MSRTSAYRTTTSTLFRNLFTPFKPWPCYTCHHRSPLEQPLAAAAAAAAFQLRPLSTSTTNTTSRHASHGLTSTSTTITQSLNSPSSPGRYLAYAGDAVSETRNFSTTSTKLREQAAPRTEDARPHSSPHPYPWTARIEAVRRRREEAGRMVAPTASYSDSDMFKDPAYKGKPKAHRWDQHFSAEALSRHAPVLKQAIKHLGKPGLVSLAGGIPLAKNFPIEQLTLRVPTGKAGFSEAETASSGKDIVVGKYDASRKPGPVPADSPPPATATATSTTTTAGQERQRREDSIYDLSIALNYSQSVGSAQLLRWVTEHAEIVSDPPYADWRCSLTIGSTGALEQAFRMLCDPSRGDGILTEEYSFATALETARPLGVDVYGVPMDEQGLIPEKMDEMLTEWGRAAAAGTAKTTTGRRDGDEASRRKRKPHVLYTVPSGQNPTGATQGEQRRRDIYAVCQKHDIYIIEDEPYYFLHMPPYTGNNGDSPATLSSSSPSSSSSSTTTSDTRSIDEFLASLTPTLLSMDTEGRVMRMDSFSKIVIPGSRVGWITASEQVVERYVRHAECASQGPSGISQLVLHQLVDETWGHAGFFKWLMHLSREYTARRDVLLHACERELGVLRRGRGEGGGGGGRVVSGRDEETLVKWVVPRAGMFLWIQIDHTAHPDFPRGKTIVEIEEEIYEACIAQGVLACRGSWFRTDEMPAATTTTAADHHDGGGGGGDGDGGGLFFRTTYAAASEEDMVKGIERLGRAVRESFRIS